MKNEYIIEDLGIVNLKGKLNLTLRLWCIDPNSKIIVTINNEVKELSANRVRPDLEKVIENFSIDNNYAFDYTLPIEQKDKIKILLKYLNKTKCIYSTSKLDLLYKPFNMLKTAIVDYHLIVPSYIFKRKIFKLANKIMGTQAKFLSPLSVAEYNMWLNKTDIESKEKASLKYKPLISIVIPVYNVPINYLKECINSILGQSYSNWELCLADDCSTDKNIKKTLNEYKKKDKRIKVVFRKENGHISMATNSALEIATGEFIGLVDNDDILDKDALLEVVKVLNKDKNIDMIYTDEDKISIDSIRCEPHFKPDFSYDSFLSQNYICHFTVLRKSIVDKIGGFRKGYEGAQDFDLFLRFINKTNNIYHIPKTLYRWRMIPGSTAMSISSKNYACERGKNAVLEFLKNKNINAQVESFYTAYKIKYEVNDDEPLAIILNGKFNKKRIDMTIKNIIENTKYKNYEIYVNTKKISGISREFSKKVTYAVINNAYIKNKIKSKYICFYEIGNVIQSGNDWLKVLVGYAKQEHVGLAAGKVLFKNSFIKNSAYIVGKKHKSLIVKDAFKGIHREAGMTAGRLILPYDYTAVNNMITVVDKNKLMTCLDEFEFSYNDIELSLNMLKNNYLNVFLPYVEVKSYKNYEKNIKITKNIKKYKDLFENDRFYNINYSVNRPFFLK